MHKLSWPNLLSEKRYDTSGASSQASKHDHQTGRTPFERDYDRIIFSAPFRRLAHKTQVHPFSKIDHIHNRLTHTLEVASVGRTFGSEAARVIEEDLNKRGEAVPSNLALKLTFIIQTACLAHDIGNPPFGHAGEFAIREWARVNKKTISGRTKSQKAIFDDWSYFDGNAQSFRMVSGADKWDSAYFNLTYASLGAMIKYPWASGSEKAKRKKKCSVFSSEIKIFEEVQKELGLVEDGISCRHPLSFLMEVADDICYRITDLEDAVELNILPTNAIVEVFEKISGQTSGGNISLARARAISSLINAAVKAFAKQYDAIMSGKYIDELKSEFDQNVKEGMEEIGKIYPVIFNDRAKLAVELGAYNTLGRILDRFAIVVKHLSTHCQYDKLSFIEKRCAALAWGVPYVKTNQDKSYQWWLGRVMDFTSGMTDNYATQVSSEIGGY